MARQAKGKKVGVRAPVKVRRPAVAESGEASGIKSGLGTELGLCTPIRGANSSSDSLSNKANLMVEEMCNRKIVESGSQLERKHEELGCKTGDPNWSKYPDKIRTVHVKLDYVDPQWLLGFLKQSRNLLNLIQWLLRALKAVQNPVQPDTATVSAPDKGEEGVIKGNQVKAEQYNGNPVTDYRIWTRKEGKQAAITGTIPINNIIVWNIRGLHSPLKERELKQLVSSTYASIIGVVEVKMKDEKLAEYMKCHWTEYEIQVVYGANTKCERTILLNQLQQVGQGIKEVWIMAGDFNSVVNSEENLGGLPVTLADIGEFKMTIDECNLW
ncbi:OLC1v1030300C1 [Oldenlandia corymbosa var. corymbosa]|uniref:OLC1v1030300C1 n=1 Tax=Oldenlandia corymbosa var. corymbosa TaxID=529605 RepID=A0AAV1CGG5_OLDCO|nr:OLC1v1030300C1 [Oldenlandia corymbosa var. corymbosa]